MKIELQIDELFITLVDADQIERAAVETIRGVLGDKSALKSAVIAISDNDTVQSLNAQYRGIHTPTDVLSFENTPDPGFPIPADEAGGFLGDIIIAYPIAAQQAQKVGHSPMDEVMLLTVHGILHLLGFDHDTPEHKSTMWHMQAQILTALGLAHVQPTEQ